MIKRIKSNNVRIINSFDIVETFNEYFWYIAGDLDRNLPAISQSSLDHVKYNVIWFFLSPVRQMECEHIIINLNKTKQSINSISVNILIEFRSNISSILCDLINDCSVAGEYPD